MLLNDSALGDPGNSWVSAELSIETIIGNSFDKFIFMERGGGKKPQNSNKHDDFNKIIHSINGKSLALNL